MRGLASGLVVFAMLCAGPTATASEQRPTLAELEGEVVCPTCKSTLDQSDAPVADQIRRFISRRIAAGDTKSQIKSRLVAEYGPGVLAEPPRRGFGALAWILPPAALLLAAAVIALLVWRWTREREPGADAGRSLDPTMERRVDEELARFEP